MSFARLPDGVLGQKLLPPPDAHAKGDSRDGCDDDGVRMVLIVDRFVEFESFKKRKTDRVDRVRSLGREVSPSIVDDGENGLLLPSSRR